LNVYQRRWASDNHSSPLNNIWKYGSSSQRKKSPLVETKAQLPLISHFLITWRLLLCSLVRSFSFCFPMATITISSLQTFPSLHSLSLNSPQNTPTLSFYSQSKPFPSISLKSFNTTLKSKPRSLSITAAFKTLSETELITVPLTADEFNSKMPSDCGVYAVYDKSNDLQFIGVTRNIGASVFSHLKSVPELCHSVKVIFFPFFCFFP